jgi:hypothetical protein
MWYPNTFRQIEENEIIPLAKEIKNNKHRENNKSTNNKANWFHDILVGKPVVLESIIFW